MDTEELVLKEFEMSSIPQDSILVFIGKRNTGKSFLVKDFLYHHQEKLQPKFLLYNIKSLKLEDLRYPHQILLSFVHLNVHIFLK